MQQAIKLIYINFELQIGMVDWKQVYLLKPYVVRLNPEVDKGRLVYRAKGSTKRISYAQIKNGLVKKKRVVKIKVPDWL